MALDTKTSDENYILNVPLKGIRRFTNEHLDSYDHFRVKGGHPRIYTKQEFMYNKFIGAMLVDIDEIYSNDRAFDQRARRVANPEITKISQDINYTGWSLYTGKPGILLVRRNGLYYVIDGRTRLYELEKRGMENIICDVFEYDGPDDENVFKIFCTEFAVFCNSFHKPFGEATYNDIEHALFGIIELGGINRNLDSQSMVSVITDKIQKMSFGKLTPQKVDTLVTKSLEKVTGVVRCISFPNGNGSEKRLIEIMGSQYYTDKENGIHYVIASADESRIHRAMIRLWNKNLTTVKEVRIIIQGGVLNPEKPAECFEEKVIGFKQIFEKYEADIAKVRFNNVNIDNSIVKLYGFIPMVYSLNSKYPMKKLGLY